MSGDRATVYLVDDEPALLRAVSRLLRAAGINVESFKSPQQFLEEHDPKTPGCVVLDLSMPGLSGLDVQAALTERHSALPVIFLSGQGDIPSSVAAMKGGAADFLTKPVDEADLIAAVHRALELNARMHAANRERVEIWRRLETLTPREFEVLVFVTDGMLNKQVAIELGTGEKTIKVHRGNVMRKMNAQSLAELVRMVERVGIDVVRSTMLDRAAARSTQGRKALGSTFNDERGKST